MSCSPESLQNIFSHLFPLEYNPVYGPGWQGSNILETSGSRLQNITDSGKTKVSVS